MYPNIRLRSGLGNYTKTLLMGVAGNNIILLIEALCHLYKRKKIFEIAIANLKYIL